MTAGPWHLRNIRIIIYIGAALAVAGIAFASTMDVQNGTQAWVGARELYGLWALGLLLASMIPGPLIFVLPWIPFKGHLILGRRALGVSCFAMAVAHVVCYLVPTLLQNWRALIAPGILWVAGLVLGLPALAMLMVLAVTSRRSWIHDMGPRRWKRLHESVYFLLPAVLIHATFMGADFGVNKGPDVISEVDFGCLVAMLSITAAWAALMILRRRRLRWTVR